MGESAAMVQAAVWTSSDAAVLAKPAAALYNRHMDKSKATLAPPHCLREPLEGVQVTEQGSWGTACVSEGGEENTENTQVGGLLPFLRPTSLGGLPHTLKLASSRCHPDTNDSDNQLSQSSCNPAPSGDNNSLPRPAGMLTPRLSASFALRRTTT